MEKNTSDEQKIRNKITAKRKPKELNTLRLKVGHEVLRQRKNWWKDGRFKSEWVGPCIIDYITDNDCAILRDTTGSRLKRPIKMSHLKPYIRGSSEKGICVYVLHRFFFFLTFLSCHDVGVSEWTSIIHSPVWIKLTLGNNVIIAVFSKENSESLQTYAKEHGIVFKVYLKITSIKVACNLWFGPVHAGWWKYARSIISLNYIQRAFSDCVSVLMLAGFTFIL